MNASIASFETSAGTHGPGFSAWPALFAAIDAGDADAFIQFLGSDAEFRFGNMPVVHGRGSIRAAVAAFFASIRSCRHRLTNIWQDVDHFVCEGEVTYTRHDGHSVSIPFVNVLALRGGTIASYRIYIDMAPLYAT